MKTVLKMFVVLLLAISLVGCGHPHIFGKLESDMYLGPERPKDELAVIKGDGHVGFLASRISLAGIHMVDSEVVKTTPLAVASGYYWKTYDADQVRVLPGPHEIVVRISKWDSFPYAGEILAGSRLLVFNLDTKAGHTYKIEIPTYWGKNSVIKIIDEATMEEVASQVVDANF